ncbi:hypothetical protein C9382_12035 [Pseudomonas aylmerensis]|uniref:Uncharacterized protein n=1 Tax=Pseudomonas aylmerensis TaxID=1869229 RepID=A0A2T4G1Y5_9PSED|nr:hypothetical protein [Pseudomonas aylmerensis]OCW20884.1 hypothetical protein BBG20_24910 [Pseudomonas aylmerensis]PTC29637.1 hypothetical protein C9382_12035 [Pseudomonas aylmerensis]
MSREDLLLKMYDQMFNDINRHILVVWQSVGVLIGAFAVFALVEKNVVSLDFAVCIVLLLSLWLMAHLFDAAYWYNRNLVIIANIERQFLLVQDLKDIHYYFGSHRPTNKMIYHLRIQMALGLVLAMLVLGYHFVDRVVPGFSLPISDFSVARSLPYILAFVSSGYLFWLKRLNIKKYEEFLRESPGKTINTTGTQYGVGHGH